MSLVQSTAWCTFAVTVGILITCKMGSDPLAVVNARLQVHSIEALRIVDASSMPNIVGGNINAAVVMIAEKAVDLISG